MAQRPVPALDASPAAAAQVVGSPHNSGNPKNRAQFPGRPAISRTPDTRPGFSPYRHVVGVANSVRPGHLFCAPAELAVDILEKARPVAFAGERAIEQSP
jgi:hypothetical protein